MNYTLKDHIIKLFFIADEDDRLVIHIFCTSYKIQTISDFLKQGENVRNEKAFEKIIESLKKKNLKFDDELTEKELIERNKEREKIKMENKINQKETEELLNKKIEILDINPKLRRKLERNQIDTIKNLISGATYLYIIKSLSKGNNIFTQKDINEIIKALDKIGLSLNMISPIIDSVDINVQEILEEEAHEEIVKTESKEGKALDTVKKQEESIKAKQKTTIVNTKAQENWKRKIEYLKVFKYYFGHVYVQEKLKDEGIGNWIKNRRNDFKRGKLTQEKIEELESIGMSWKGVGVSSDAKEKIYRPLNIKDVTVENGILYTYYIDGTVKATSDAKFKDLLKQYREGITNLSELEDKTSDEQIEEAITEEVIDDFLDSLANEQDEVIEETTQIDSYSLMQARIEEMKAKKQTIEEENTRKRLLIEEYRKLKIELDSLIEEEMLLDTTINNIIGISTSVIDDEISPVKSPSTVSEFQESKDELKKIIDEKRGRK